MKAVMTFHTMLSAQMIEQLLESHCLNARSARFTGLEITDEGTRKTVTIEFEDFRDRDRFRRGYNALNRDADAASPEPAVSRQRTQKARQKTSLIHSLTAGLFGQERPPQRRTSR